MEDKWCTGCAQNGMQMKLKLFQIHENEAIWMCTNEKCTHTLELPQLTTVKRKLKDIAFPRKKRKLKNQNTPSLSSTTSQASSPSLVPSSSLESSSQPKKSKSEKALTIGLPLKSRINNHFGKSSQKNANTGAFKPYVQKTSSNMQTPIDLPAQNHQDTIQDVNFLDAFDIPDVDFLDQPGDGFNFSDDLIDSCTDKSVPVESLSTSLPDFDELFKSKIEKNDQRKKVRNRTISEKSVGTKIRPKVLKNGNCDNAESPLPRTSFMPIKEDVCDRIPKLLPEKASYNSMQVFSSETGHTHTKTESQVNKMIKTKSEARLGEKSPEGQSKKTESPHQILDSKNENVPMQKSLNDNLSQLSSEKKFMIWKNEDALCWLDVCLCLLVHCKTLHKVLAQLDSKESSVISVLHKSYLQAQQLFMKALVSKKIQKTVLSLETSVGTVPIKTGGGERPFITTPPIASDPKAAEQSSPINAKCDNTTNDLLEKYQYDIQNILRDARNVVWWSLQPQLKCVKGKNDSPVFAMPLLLKQSPAIEKAFMVNYAWKMTCTQCGNKKVDRVQRSLPTFPHVPKDFTMESPCFIRTCFTCNAPDQKMVMNFERIPPVLLLHFVEGLPNTKLMEETFVLKEDTYRVTGVIQFKNDPDHFITWIRDPNENLWMECDDIKPYMCQFLPDTPTFAAHQIHIVMWEKDGDTANVEEKEGSRMPTLHTLVRETLSQNSSVSSKKKGIELDQGKNIPVQITNPQLLQGNQQLNVQHQVPVLEGSKLVETGNPLLVTQNIPIVQGKVVNPLPVALNQVSGQNLPQQNLSLPFSSIQENTKQESAIVKEVLKTPCFKSQETKSREEIMTEKLNAIRRAKGKPEIVLKSTKEIPKEKIVKRKSEKNSKKVVVSKRTCTSTPKPSYMSSANEMRRTSLLENDISTTPAVKPSTKYRAAVNLLYESYPVKSKPKTFQGYVSKSLDKKTECDKTKNPGDVQNKVTVEKKATKVKQEKSKSPKKNVGFNLEKRNSPLQLSALSQVSLSERINATKSIKSVITNSPKKSPKKPVATYNKGVHGAVSKKSTETLCNHSSTNRKQDFVDILANLCQELNTPVPEAVRNLKSSTPSKSN